MARLINFVTIMVFIDLVFILAGLSGQFSPTSILINAVVDPSNIENSPFWLALIGVFVGTVALTGIKAILASSTVASGFSISVTDTLLFIPIALSLSSLVGDFISIYLVLKAYSIILATIIMGPMMIIYGITVVEWLRGRD